MKRVWMCSFGLGLVLWAAGYPAASQVPAPASPPAAPQAAPTGGGDTLDVSWTKPYAEAVQSKSDLLILNQPLDATMTRLELARWLMNVFDFKFVPGKKEAPLKDVPRRGPDYLNVQALLQAGVMATFPGGVFKPQGDLTRLEALAIFDRALKLTAPSKPIVDSWLKLYKDAGSVPQAGREFIAAAAQAGLIINVPAADTLSTDDVLTRGEMAVLLHQGLVYQKKLAAVEPPVAQLKIEKPAIASIDVQPASRVLPGQTVTITAQGTPGATSSFDLGDLANNVAMKETTPGQYIGTYKVADRDAVVNPTVVVHLDRGGLTAQAQRIARLEVGEVRAAQAPANQPDNYDYDDPAASQPPPRRSSNSPGDYSRRAGGFNDDYGTGSSRSYNSSPNFPDDNGFPAAPPIGGSYGNSRSAGRFGSGNPPIASTRRGGDLFNPPSPFEPVQPAGNLRIQQVSFDPVNRVLNTGDILTVSCAGDSGGKATFKIAGVTGPIKMKEISPGFYEGRVQIGKNINVPGGTIEVALERNGQRITRTIPQPINISSLP
ncbi:S-layer homology domain-containing protein [Gloeobacter kilaueensis]|uniref:SLH domain-containing protein n=1 Tax=Gloeobacter kilaueensis (strain ATCC BAA-2537 / CCAP 1431/1 / ULC 316 / JS1) TaxID=1183438 RepID=U5QRW0_GLOK1|nr:S-layer homology domain-containing protein [Gloeobacter kilaueensis]AGY60349.1 hypothetical protein GKIL_4103 [Gloeobacter kilaueensis JS1]